MCCKYRGKQIKPNTCVQYLMQKGGMYDRSLRAIVLPVWAEAHKLQSKHMPTYKTQCRWAFPKREGQFYSLYKEYYLKAEMDDDLLYRKWDRAQSWKSKDCLSKQSLSVLGKTKVYMLFGTNMPNWPSTLSTAFLTEK